MIAEIISLPGYESQVSDLMDEEQRTAMEFFIACGPEDHPLIVGSGGFRKARWALPGRGKSAGVRVVYFFIAQPEASLHGVSVRQVSKADTLSSGSQGAGENCRRNQEGPKE